jgi:hypothetical protein
MSHRYWKYVKWLGVASALVTFVVLPLAPVYGFARPWPEAEEALRKAGIMGALFMIGGGWTSSYSATATGEQWWEERQRSFVAIPESLRAGELYTYIEVQTSGTPGVKSEVLREKMLAFIFVVWVISGIVSIVSLHRWRGNWPNQSVQPTPGSVTPRASSSS